MLNYFWNVIPLELKQFYSWDNNLELYKTANPDTYAAMERLSEILKIPVL